MTFEASKNVITGRIHCPTVAEKWAAARIKRLCLAHSSFCPHSYLTTKAQYYELSESRCQMSIIIDMPLNQAAHPLTPPPWTEKPGPCSQLAMPKSQPCLTKLVCSSPSMRPTTATARRTTTRISWADSNAVIVLARLTDGQARKWPSQYACITGGCTTQGYIIKGARLAALSVSQS